MGNIQIGAIIIITVLHDGGIALICTKQVIS